MEGVLPRAEYVEHLKCSSKELDVRSLGKVGYLCRGIPIYELKSSKKPVPLHAGQRRKSSDNENVFTF